MQLFYANIHDSHAGIILSEEESKHCIKVLRKKIGDRVQVVDGYGGFYECEIMQDKPKHCTLKVLSEQKEFRKRDFQLTIAIAPTKNLSRFEWFLEKATEIGIDRIIPIITSRSERKRLKEERLERIVLTAMKQSGRAYLPELLPLTQFTELVKSDNTKLKCIATCDSKNHLKLNYNCADDVCIIVGPEGDFTQEEIILAKENGFKEVSLGPSRLRVETAGIVACHTINMLNE